MCSCLNSQCLHSNQVGSIDHYVSTDRTVRSEWWCQGCPVFAAEEADDAKGGKIPRKPKKDL